MAMLKHLPQDLACRYRIWKNHAKAFRAIGLDPIPVHVCFSRSSLLPHDGMFRRLDGGKFELELTGMDPVWAARAARNKVPAYLYWFANCPDDIREMSICVSDGDRASTALFAPSTADPETIAIPDPYFFNRHAFDDMRRVAGTSNVLWAQRSGKLRWRGATSGEGRYDFAGRAIMDPTVNLRLRLLMHARRIDGLDACFVSAAWQTWLENMLRHYGYWGDPIPEADWINDKFAIDIDGQTNTWSNFIARLHLGCCVLKVDSQFGYRQWYYDRIKPWEHFVPVKADMSDLAEKIDWARSNDARAEEIARNGQAFARTMTFESETKAAVELITNGVRSHALSTN
jgi:hypothetical protein